MFPDDNFAVICCSTVERKDVKPNKGIYRAEMFSGYVMRQDKDTVALTFIFHSNGKVKKQRNLTLRDLWAIYPVFLPRKRALSKQKSYLIVKLNWKKLNKFY